MTPRLSPAQRRAVTGSDPATGRLKAGVRVCTALVAAGLAVPHGRGGHHSVYLTREGLLLRAELARADAEAAAGGEPPADTEADGAEPAGTFTPDDGTGAAAVPRDPARRAADVASAWEGLLQIRSLLGGGTAALPAPWERERPVHAVALALEAAGCPPARPPRATATDGPAAPDSPNASGGPAAPDSPEASGGSDAPDSPGDPAPGGSPRSPRGPAASNPAASHASDPSGGPGAAGRPGYRVSASSHPGLVEVSWSGPRSGDALAKCAALLPSLGWQATTHRTRSGSPYLLVSPAGRTR